MATLMQQLAEVEGSCCVFAYFMANQDKSHEDLERHLGISMEQIIIWRRKIRRGTCTCKSLPGCILKCEPPNFPEISLLQSALRKVQSLTPSASESSTSSRQSSPLPEPPSPDESNPQPD